jgi:hypothetical protein
MVFQPICSLRDKAICGFESLSRFDVEPRHAPDYWFDVADKAGLGIDLELCAVSKVLPALERLPANSSVSVNCSPQLLLSSKFHQLLDGIDDLSVWSWKLQNMLRSRITRLLPLGWSLTVAGARNWRLTMLVQAIPACGISSISSPRSSSWI